MAIYIDDITKATPINSHRVKTKTGSGTTVTFDLYVPFWFDRAVESGDWEIVGDPPCKGISVMSRGGDKLVAEAGMLCPTGIDNPDRFVLMRRDVYVSAAGDLWHNGDKYAVRYSPNLLDMKVDFVIRKDSHLIATGELYDQSGTMIVHRTLNVVPVGSSLYTTIYTAILELLHETSI